jgi:hemerythrin
VNYIKGGEKVPILWTKDLSIGVEEIDKQLLERINTYINRTSEGYSKEKIVDAFRFLDDYTIAHFNAEENMADKYGYTDTALKSEHRSFKKNLAEFKKDMLRIEKEGNSSILALQSTSLNFISWLLNWLTKHLAGTDMKLGKFLSTKIKQSRYEELRRNEEKDFEKATKVDNVKRALELVKNVQKDLTASRPKIIGKEKRVLEFDSAAEFNSFSFEVKKVKNTDIDDIRIFENKYLITISIYPEMYDTIK